METFNVGTLKVTLKRALGIKGDEVLGMGKANPYVVIKFGKKKFKSNTAKGQGSEPVWNQLFGILINDVVHELRLKIYNKNTMRKDYTIGEARIKLEDVFANPGKETSNFYDVVRKHSRIRGQIEVVLTFEPQETNTTTVHNEMAAETAASGETLANHNHEVTSPSVMSDPSDAGHNDHDNEFGSRSTQMGYPQAGSVTDGHVMGYPIYNPQATEVPAIPNFGSGEVRRRNGEYRRSDSSDPLDGTQKALRRKEKKNRPRNQGRDHSRTAALQAAGFVAVEAAANVAILTAKVFFIASALAAGC